jgi:hypothetical protein
VPVEVEVLTRAESVAVLRNRVPWLAETDAEKVAAAMGDLPLGVAQAAGYKRTGTTTKRNCSPRKCRTGRARIVQPIRPECRSNRSATRNSAGCRLTWPRAQSAWAVRTRCARADRAPRVTTPSATKRS